MISLILYDGLLFCLYNMLMLQSILMLKRNNTSNFGFTIVELLIVVVVIGILAAISLVTYSGIQQNAAQAVLKSDLNQASTQLDIIQVQDGAYPATNPGLAKSGGTTLSYSGSGGDYCLQATSDKTTVSFYITNQTGVAQEGDCSSSILHMQNITTANCPANRTMAVDARDNHTYWVQKFSDGRCWMLTNLAYGGSTSNGGTGNYGDVREVYETVTASTNSQPRYSIHANANPTVYPTAPSVSTDGGNTSPQYGYHYNWCAAMGSQLLTAACASQATPIPDSAISICPAGWRLSAGTNSSEFSGLNTAVNGGLTGTDAGLRSVWLAQIGGYNINGIHQQSTTAYYWTSRQGSSVMQAITLRFSDSSVVVSGTQDKSRESSVRCTAV